VKLQNADRTSRFAPVLQAFRIEFPVAPREENRLGNEMSCGCSSSSIVTERSASIMSDAKGLRLPVHEKSVSSSVSFVAKFADWRSMPSGKLERELYGEAAVTSARAICSELEASVPVAPRLQFVTMWRVASSSCARQSMHGLASACLPVAALRKHG